MEGEGAANDWTCQNWFENSCVNFFLNNALLSEESIGWYEKSNTILNIILINILQLPSHYLSVSFFKADYDKRWIVDSCEQCGTQKIRENVQWTLTNDAVYMKVLKLSYLETKRLAKIKSTFNQISWHSDSREKKLCQKSVQTKESFITSRMTWGQICLW